VPAQLSAALATVMARSCVHGRAGREQGNGDSRSTVRRIFFLFFPLGDIDWYSSRRCVCEPDPIYAR